MRRDDDRTEPRTSAGNDRDDADRSEYDNIPGTDCPACAEKGLTCIGRCPAERSRRE